MLQISRYKKLFLIPCLVVISSCVISPPLTVEVRNSGESYDSWDYYTYVDDFDGKYLVSKASSYSGGLISIFTSVKQNISSFQYKNGDAYICSIYSGLNTKMIFTKYNGQTHNHEVYLSLSADNTVLYAKPLGGNENQLISLLNMYDFLKIRTIDSCGTTSDHFFNISGTTHLKPYEVF